MKTILTAILMLTATLAMAAPDFGNYITGETATSNTLSRWMPRHVQNPTAAQIWEQRKSEGWRKVTEVASPSEGYRVASWSVRELTANNCALDVATQINIADEIAGQKASAESNRLARIEFDKARIVEWMDNDYMNYGIGFYTCKNMVSNHIAATMQDARQLILDKAYSKINTNSP